MKYFISICRFLFSTILIFYSNLLICQTSPVKLPEKGSMVFYGHFHKGNFVYYYTLNDVIEFYGKKTMIERDSTYTFKEEFSDIKEFCFNYNQEKVRYHFFPNDSIEIVYQAKETFKLKSKDTIRQHELDFEFYLDSIGAQDFNYANGNITSIKKNYLTNSDLLEKLHEQNRVSEKFNRCYKLVLKCIYINQCLFPILVSKKDEKLPTLSIPDLIKEFPLDNTLLPIYAYKQTLHNIVMAEAILEGRKLRKADLVPIVEKYFKDDLKGYVLAAIIRSDIVHNKFDYKDEQLFLKATEGTKYRDSIASYFNRSFEKFPELINLKGEKIALLTKTEEAKDSTIYVDFWASWCAPCLEELKYESKLKNLSRDKKITYIYISLDDDVEAWEAGVNKHAFMNINNSFRLDKSASKNFIRQSNLGPIPRYMTIKNSEFIRLYAKRPSEIVDINDLLTPIY